MNYLGLNRDETESVLIKRDPPFVQDLTIKESSSLLMQYYLSSACGTVLSAASSFQAIALQPSSALIGVLPFKAAQFNQFGEYNCVTQRLYISHAVYYD